MGKHKKKVYMGVVTALFTILGMLEYVQLMQSFDLPQIILVMPIIGALSMILLGKWSFLVPVLTTGCACLYQIVAGNANAIYELRTNPASIVIVLLECVSVLLVFEMIGIAGGALIRVLIRGKQNRMARILCGMLGVVLSVGSYLAVFHNPLYPVTARVELNQKAEEQWKDSVIADKKIYYSLQSSSYVCRVMMSDGEIQIVGE